MSPENQQVSSPTSLGDDRPPGGAEPTLIERVRKLMDKAAATDNLYEADAFSRKAAELVARHRIDPAALVARIDDELAIREIHLGRGAYVRARLALLMAVAEAHDGRVLFGATPTGTIAYVAGHTSDLDVIEVMYTSLHTQAATRMAAERRSTAAATQRYRRSFLFGYADRIAALLQQARKHAEEELSPGDRFDPAGTALARRRRTSRVEEFLQQRFGRVRTARTAAGADLGGWNAGGAAADRADLGREQLDEQRSLGRG